MVQRSTCCLITCLSARAPVSVCLSVDHPTHAYELLDHVSHIITLCVCVCVRTSLCDDKGLGTLTAEHNIPTVTPRASQKRLAPLDILSNNCISRRKSVIIIKCFITNYKQREIINKIIF